MGSHEWHLGIKNMFKRDDNAILSDPPFKVA